MKDEPPLEMEAPAPPTMPSSVPQTAAGPATPIDPSRRLVTVDAVRGFAVLGILIVNAASFAMPMAWVDMPLAYGPHGPRDLVVWTGIDIFAAGKFVTLFSTLFGAGVWLMTDRADAAGRSTAATHYKRMGWLLLFGAVHAYLIWYGDILFTYALAGLVLYPMRWLSVRWQLVLAGVMLVLATLLTAAWGGLFLLWEAVDPQDFAEFELYAQEDIEAEIAAYRGGLLQQVVYRVPTTLAIQFFVLVSAGPWFLAMMLLGMVLVRTGVLGGERSRAFYVNTAGTCLTAGLALSIATHLLQRSLDPADPAAFMFLTLGDYWIAPLVGYGYAALLILLIRSGRLSGLSDALAATGRMALTNYLLQSVIFTFIFYGHGLGHFAMRSWSEVVLVVVATWLLQLWLSPIWLARFRYGPMEWLWRTLTYGRRQPMRVAT